MLFSPNMDTNGNLIHSPEAQIATDSFIVEGLLGECNPATTTYSDVLKIQELGVDKDTSVCGLHFTTVSHEHGDYARLEVVDVDDLLGYGAGTVIGNFGQRFYIPATGDFFMPPMMRKKTIPAGFYYRMRYVATNFGSSRKYELNLFLLKQELQMPERKEINKKGKKIVADGIPMMSTKEMMEKLGRLKKKDKKDKDKQL